MSLSISLNVDKGSLHITEIFDESDELYNPKNNYEEKFELEKLFIEITRRCNFSCKHCLRGDAQSISISKNVIDRLFEDVGNVKMIGLTGGEPLIALSEIEYFCNKLIQSEWAPLMIEIVTNGSASQKDNERLIEMLCNLVKVKNTSCFISISFDQFHEEFDKNHLQASKTMIYLVSELSKRGMLCKDSSSSTGKIRVSIMDPKVGGIERNTIYPEGRAKKLINGANSHKYNFLDIIHADYPYTIKADNKTIYTPLSILSNGNISLIYESDYEYEDNNCLGNILEASLYEIIDKYNNYMAIASYSEVQNYTCLMNHYKYSGLTNDLREIIYFDILKYKRLLDSRKIIKELCRNNKDFNSIDIRKIIPIVNSEIWFSNIGMIYICLHPHETLRGMNKQEIVTRMIKMLNDKEIDFKQFGYLSSDKKQVISWFEKYGYNKMKTNEK